MKAAGKALPGGTKEQNPGQGHGMSQISMVNSRVTFHTLNGIFSIAGRILVETEQPQVGRDLQSFLTPQTSQWGPFLMGFFFFFCQPLWKSDRFSRDNSNNSNIRVWRFTTAPDPCVGFFSKRVLPCQKISSGKEDETLPGWLGFLFLGTNPRKGTVGI